MNKHIKFIAICLGYTLLCYLIGFSWLYFGLLAIADIFYWRNINWPYYRPSEEEKNNKQPGFFKELFNAILFAIIGATLIHTFVIQPFTIPTSSMEGSMKVGDYLLVSKLNYGPVVPNTPVALPFMHNTLLFTTNTKPYSEVVQLGYHRMEGYTKVKNNDIVVFNYPVDKLYDTMPFDKKTHYVKRCLGIAGDVLEVRDRDVFVNQKPLELPDRSEIQYKYTVKLSRYTEPDLVIPEQQNKEIYRTFFDQGIGDVRFLGAAKKTTGYFYFMHLNEKSKAAIEQRADFLDIKLAPVSNSHLYPQGVETGWDWDNYGPITIPARGMTIAMTKQNFDLYQQAINEYEGKQDLIWQDHQALLNGKPISEYTFTYDYYWMMGDNRHNSLDSRAWGFVPETNIVGKPVFTFFSKDYFGDIQWNRMFKVIHGKGEAQSYLIHFLILLGLFQGWSYYKKKKAKKTA
ncbi:MAG: signal peptidase I [Flavobacteriales bacterium]